MKINIPLHTIIMTVGPSMCGKSTFVQESTKTLREKYKEIRTHTLSSDEIRQGLLGYEAHKYSAEMAAASEQAFHLLKEKLNSLTSYPINSHVIFVDTTALSEDFRKHIQEVAKKKNYHLCVVSFDFKEKEEYLKHLVDPDYKTKKIIYSHVERYKKEVKRTLKKRYYSQIEAIKSKDYNLDISISNWSEYKRNIISDNYLYDIVGDIHGCFKSFIALIEKLGYQTKDGRITKNCLKDKDKELYKGSKMILVGDLIDKGESSKEVINFVLNNQEYFVIVWSNHEEWVYRHFKGTHTGSIPEKVRLEYFSTSEEFKNDTEFQEALYKLKEISHPYVESGEFIVTHAPCEEKFLGKLDNKSLRAQRNIRQARREEFSSIEEYKSAIEEHFSFLKKESRNNYKKHVFGHWAMKSVLKIKNKFGIDTGIVHGNRLTAVRFVNGRTVFKAVDSLETKIHPEELLSFFERKKMKKENVSLETELSPEEAFRIDYLLNNNLNFLSGTVSPSASSKTELEPLSNAFSYYKSKGITEVVLQPKYMGSRGNVYLFKDVEKSYAVSRKGFKIKMDLKEIFERLRKKYDDKFQKGVELLILDGEIMPWSAIGQGLIEDHFQTISKGVSQELSFLEEFDFEKKLASMKKERNVSFQKDRIKIAKKKLKKEYGDTVYESYINMDRFDNFSIENEKNGITIFKEQLNLFGSEGELDYKPFAILKEVYTNGEEKTIKDFDNYEVFNYLNDDRCVKVNLEDEESIIKAEEFFNYITNDLKLEGVVVKPLKGYIEEVAPFIKVRNENYLTLIYGYNYKEENFYKTLVDSKKIKRKIDTSIKEYKLAIDMLAIPFKEINENNEKLRQIFYNFIVEEKKEKELDPRL